MSEIIVTVIETGISTGTSIAMLGVAFLLSTFAWQLKDGLHESYAMFCMLMSSALVVGFVGLIRISYQGLSGLLDAFYYAVIIWFVITMVYFILRVMIAPMIAANKKKRFELK